MEYTSNYHLSKPDGDDIINPTSRTGYNGNFDTLDTTIKSVADDVDALETDVGTRPSGETDTLWDKIDILSNSVDGLETSVDGLETDVSALRAKFYNTTASGESSKTLTISNNFHGLLTIVGASANFSSIFTIATNASGTMYIGEVAKGSYITENHSTKNTLTINNSASTLAYLRFIIFDGSIS